jgi:hypothetical protein
MVGPAFAFLPELLDGQVFEDPLLDLLEIEVILVQYLTGPVDVDGPPAHLAPGQARHPLEKCRGTEDPRQCADDINRRAGWLRHSLGEAH